MDRRQFLLAALAAFGGATPGGAASLRYDIGPDGATITYIFSLSGAEQRGTAPLASADIRVDPSDLVRSSAEVTADVRQAQTGIGFITEALKSPEVLNAEAHPLARFRSTKITLGSDGRISSGATLEGDLTLRGVTRPIRFDAALYRPRGTAPNDLRRLNVRLTGRLSRAAFGATGFASFVSDTVTLDISADVQQL